MTSVTLTINGINKTVDVEPDTPLLWVIRDHLHLTGTKYGCGIAQCGACTVHLDGQAIRSCVMPVSAVVGKNIITIEGISADQQSNQSKAVQQAWEDIAVVQCGYCQSGQIMSATALLTSNPNPSDKDIDDFMSGNICRCSTYVRIKKAIKQAADTLAYNAMDKTTDKDLHKSNHRDVDKTRNGARHHGSALEVSRFLIDFK